MFRFPSAPRSVLRTAAALSIALGGSVVASTLSDGASAQVYGEPSYVRISRYRSKVVRIPRPADTVVVGDPNIADVVLQDSTTLVLTGKTLGETNLIILDEAGDPIVDETIVVGLPDTTTVSVYRPLGRSNFRCSPDCTEMTDGTNNTNN